MAAIACTPPKFIITSAPHKCGVNNRDCTPTLGFGELQTKIFLTPATLAVVTSSQPKLYEHIFLLVHNILLY